MLIFDFVGKVGNSLQKIKTKEDTKFRKDPGKNKDPEHDDVSNLRIKLTPEMLSEPEENSEIISESEDEGTPRNENFTCRMKDEHALEDIKENYKKRKKREEELEIDNILRNEYMSTEQRLMKNAAIRQSNGAYDDTTQWTFFLVYEHPHCY